MSSPNLPPSFPACRTRVSHAVESVSPRFLSLFRHAKAAEAIGLFDLAGMGYRKALECLVKDALVFFRLESPQSAASLPLRAALCKCLSDTRFASRSSRVRAVSDEFARYDARFEPPDLAALKHCIRYVAFWIAGRAPK